MAVLYIYGWNDPYFQYRHNKKWCKKNVVKGVKPESVKGANISLKHPAVLRDSNSPDSHWSETLDIPKGWINTSAEEEL